MKKNNQSNAETTTLEWVEAVRKRPAMYVGSTGFRGFVYLLKEALTKTQAGLKAGHVSIEILDDISGKLIFDNLKNPVKDEICENLSLPDYELAAFNALSERFETTFFDDARRELKKLCYEQGILKKGTVEKIEFRAGTLEIIFKLDQNIWEPFAINPFFVAELAKESAFLNKERIIEVKYRIKNETSRIVYHFANGLHDLFEIEKLKGLGATFFDTHFETEFDGFAAEAAFGFRNYTVDEPFLRSFVNNHYTHENGTHVEGLLKGLTYGVMKYFQKHELTTKYKISEKGMRENIVAAIHVRMKQPVFSGCVKNKLASSEIIEPLAEYVANLLFEKIEKDAESTENLIRKFRIRH